MGLLEKLGLRSSAGAAAADPSGDTETVRRIVSELESLEPVRARHIAAFAFILSRVANADLEISHDETRKMEEIVREHGGLPEEQAILVVQIAKSQNRLFGSTENFLVTREFKEISTRQERLQLLECLFHVSAADLAISTVEEERIRQIATELGFGHREYVEVRSAFSEHREILKPLRSEE